MNGEVTSDIIFSLYTKTNKDDGVYAVIDGRGINVIRKYEDEKLSDYRMFIKFSVSDNNSIWGGVDMVKAPANKEDGYSIVSENEILNESLFKKYINYSIGKENIYFDINKSEINFKNKFYKINTFIDLLAKNHTAGFFDMFWKGRFINQIKTYFIMEPLFWIVNLNYKKDKINFLLSERYFNTQDKGIKIELPEDPFFRYFKIYKNLLILFGIILLVPIFWLSIELNTNYYSITNPFLLMAAFLMFASLEKISFLLYASFENKKDGFIRKMEISIINVEGKLKI